MLLEHILNSNESCLVRIEVVFLLRVNNWLTISIVSVVCMSIILCILMNFVIANKTLSVSAKKPAIISSLDTMESIAFSEDTSLFTNPERGWYRPFKSDDIWGLDKLKALGISVILIETNLKNFLTTPISDAKLTEIQNAFTSARNYGLQVMFRAAYDYTGLASCEPKSLSIIKGHIAQLKSIFYANEDILFCVQAGFLGPWGEWHSSYYGDTPSLEARKTVLFALMDAVPKSRTIQIRRPMFIRDIFQNEIGGNVITEETAYNGSNLSRTGFHNDALLSTEDEYGTYVDSKFSRQDELNWVDNHDRYTPFGGESCYLGEKSNPDNAIFELTKLHAQVINLDYLPSVITKWKTTTYNAINTFNYISSRLGYRFVLIDANINSNIKKGGVIHLSLKIKNDGFGNPINARDFEVVLDNGTVSYVAKVNDDLRRWYRENSVMAKDLYFSIPSDISSGLWNVSLKLSSPFQTLKANPSYSIRFANTGIWNASIGVNLIKSGIAINSSIPQSIVSSFVQISRNEAILLVSKDSILNK